MKLLEAVELGEACGLGTVEEAVNNVILHSPNLFHYRDVSVETAELRKEAEAEGVKFCNCGGAISRETGTCHLCDTVVLAVIQQDIDSDEEMAKDSKASYLSRRTALEEIGQLTNLKSRLEKARDEKRRDSST